MRLTSEPSNLRLPKLAARIEKVRNTALFGMKLCCKCRAVCQSVDNRVSCAWRHLWVQAVLAVTSVLQFSRYESCFRDGCAVDNGTNLMSFVF